MPAKDGTGPMGMGSMTGRGRGGCNLSVSRTTGRCGAGGGRGYRQWVNGISVPVNSSNTEEKNLKEEAKMLKQQLESITNRINELHASEKK